MKSDKLSPNPEDGVEPCLWSSRACRPALRFLALFLLLALADAGAGLDGCGCGSGSGLEA